jgi:hypothetical protein
LEALLAQPLRVGGAGVAPEERERGQVVEIAEQPDRSRPEPLELGAQLVGQRHPGLHEILSRASQCPQRLGLIAVGLQYPEAMVVGARQLAQHERVEAVRLAARGAEPGAGGGDLVGMQRQKHRSPASNRRSTSSPSGRSIATNVTFIRTSVRHSDRSPFSSCANEAANSSSPASSCTTTSCFSDAQSTPA